MGFPVWDLSPARKLLIQADARRLRAQDVLRQHGLSMSADDLYDWVLAATGSKAAAERAHYDRRRALLKGGAAGADG